MPSAVPAGSREREPATSRCLHGIPAFFPPGMKVLVIGSFPSVVSLERNEYYANPRNQFWGIMHSITGVPAGVAYGLRLSGLAKAGIGLSDALASCERPGSSDRAIRNPVYSDFSETFARNPLVVAVLANGAAAYDAFRAGNRHHPLPRGIELVRCPSTSPAYAVMGLEEKTELWISALGRFVADIRFVKDDG